MKNNKPLIIGIAAVAIIAIVAVVAVVVNNNNGGKNTSNNSSSSSTSGSLWSQDGIEIKKATISQVSEGSFNIITIFANRTDQDVEFDNSKFRFELADGYVIKPAATTKTLKANNSYLQFAQSLSKEENSHLKLGDTVTTYYGDTKLGTSTIE